MTRAAGFSPNVLRILSLCSTGAECHAADDEKRRHAPASSHYQFPRASDSGRKCFGGHAIIARSHADARLDTENSMLMIPGPMIVLRPELPKRSWSPRGSRFTKAAMD